MVIWNLVFFMTISTDFGIIAIAKRRNPGPNEIERVINETHSSIWNCQECNPGLGLSVHCGTSIPISIQITCVPCVEGTNFSDTHDYSTCKRCKICSTYEKKEGECTTEEDTTKCLGICHKGFYMDLLSAECHQCSDCCGHSVKYHETQCENSGLPNSKQCRKHNFSCLDIPTKNTDTPTKNTHTPTINTDTPTEITDTPTKIIDTPTKNTDIPSKNTDMPTKITDTPTKSTGTPTKYTHKQGLESSEIVGVVVGIILFAVFVVVLGFVKGWHEIRSTLMSWFYCCWHLGDSNGGLSTLHFNASDHQVQILKYDPELGTANSGHNYNETSDRSSELSDLVVHQEMQAQPPAVRKKTQREFSRSYSDPGASHMQLGKDISGSKCNPAQFLASPKPKRLSKGGYSLLALDEHLDEDVFNSSSKSTDAGFQQPKKPERIAEPSMITQHTSTTSLYLLVTVVAPQLNGIPQDFLNNLLSKQVSVIPYRFYSRICVKLNTLRELAFDDYRSFGEAIGLSKAETSYLGQLKNPTHEIIEKFEAQRGSCIGKFREILEQMKRIDVVDVVDEWLKHEWLTCFHSSYVDGRPQTFI